MRIGLVVLVVALAWMGSDAYAQKRLGGGKSVGRQSSNVTQREATSPAPAVPQNAAVPAQKAAPVVPPPKRNWGGMLGGLAAGLGLAWLAHSLGLGSAMGSLLLFFLVAGLLYMVWRTLARKPAPVGFAGGNSGMGFLAASPANISESKRYSPDTVGNDASARPWERNSMAFELDKVGAAQAVATPASASWGVPAGFDSDGFLRSAKANFVALQDAWDRSDIAALRAMMTDSMLAEIQSQLAQRETHTGHGFNRTEVVMLEARLLGIEELLSEYMASVEFSGMIREEVSSGPSPFREVWNMNKAKDGSHGWLVAGVQALQ